MICADCGKESRKRAVYVADVAERTVRRLKSDDWTLARLLSHAETWTARGTVLVTMTPYLHGVCCDIDVEAYPARPEGTAGPFIGTPRPGARQ